MGSRRFNFKKKIKKTYQIEQFNILIINNPLHIVEMWEREEDGNLPLEIN